VHYERCLAKNAAQLQHFHSIVDAQGEGALWAGPWAMGLFLRTAMQMQVRACLLDQALHEELTWWTQRRRALIF
jgi:hypothetical protein